MSLRSFFVAVLALYAVAGFLVVPTLVKKLLVDTVRERTGREPTVEAVRCNPFTLSLTVRGFSMPDRPGSTLLRFDSLYANAQASSLFRWALVLKELRLKNPYVGLRRFADGRINVRELLDEVERRAPAEEVAAAQDEAAALPRSVLRHILVTGARVEVEDFARDEPLTLDYGPSVFEFHDISTLPDRKGDNAFDIGLHRGGKLSVVGDVVVEPLGLEGTVSADGLFLESAWPFLEPYFEFDVVNGQASGSLHYSVGVADDGLHVGLTDLDFDLRQLYLRPRGAEEDALELERVRIAGGRVAWPEGEVGATALEVEGAQAFARIEPDGALSWEALVPPPTRDDVVEVYKKVEQALPWTAAVDRLEVRRAGARLEDRTFEEPLTLTLEEASLSIAGITTEPGEPWRLETSAKLPGGATAAMEGTVAIGPIRLEARIDLQDLDLTPFQPYLARLAPVELAGGRVETSGTIRFAPGGDGPLASFAGDVAIDGFDLRETLLGSRPLRWERVEVRGIEAAEAPRSLRVAGIDVRGAGVEIVTVEENRINLVELVSAIANKTAATEESVSSGEAPKPEPAALPPIAVGVVSLHDCGGAFVDRTLEPPFTLALDPIEGKIEGISTSSEAGAELGIEGTLAGGGIVAVQGELDLLDPRRLARVSLDVREAAVPPLSPMAVRYLGHPIDRGTANVGLRYEVRDSQLSGQNRIVTQNLALGEKVPGQGTTGLPVKLGVSLLTDKNGRITLDFPVQGDLDDPGFDVGSAIGSAVKDVMGSLVKSPFRLLGKLGGGGDRDDYGWVEFAAGRADLASTAQAKLRTIATGAAQRPELFLRVAGAWEPEVDTPALQAAALDRLLARRAAEPTGGTPESTGSTPESTGSTTEPTGSTTESTGPTTEPAGGTTEGAAAPSGLELLEALFVESASAEELERLRAEHTRAGAEGEEPALDETGYSRGLRRRLAAAQTVDEAALRELGAARAESIRALLVDEAGMDAARVRMGESAATEPTGEAWVRVPLDVSAGD